MCNSSITYAHMMEVTPSNWPIVDGNRKSDNANEWLSNWTVEFIILHKTCYCDGLTKATEDACLIETS